MPHPHLKETDTALAEAAKRYDFVLVPGLYDSRAEHWQSYWQNRHDFWLRVSHNRWSTPSVGVWIDAIRRLLASRRNPAILVGHSFGALASCCVAAAGTPRVAGLMLVAPAEPARFELEDEVPTGALGVPAIVVASHDDPLMRFDRAIHWSRAWGAELVDLGEAGHINCESGYGPWPYGLEVLRRLVDTIDAGGAVEAAVSLPPL